MRILLLAAVLILATPAVAQQGRLGARTQSPDSMVAQMRNVSPDEELAALIAEADRHPIGTAENPVRVGGPEGERAYLARLRCADGSAVRVGARREAGTGAFGTVIAAYDVACPDGAGRILFDMYHEEHVENRAPPGYTIIP